MKRIIKMSVGALLSVGCLTANVLPESSKLNKSIENIPILQKNKVHVVSTKDLGQVLYVEAKGGNEQKTMLFFITKDKKVIIEGRGIDAKTSTPIIIKPKLEGKENFTYGNGKKVLYVFSDPQCPYCKMLEKNIPSLKDKYTFKFILDAYHSNSKKMIEYILNSKTDKEKFDKLLEIANGSEKYKNNTLTNQKRVQIDKIIKQNLNISNRVNLRGTPEVLDKNMKRYNWNQL